MATSIPQESTETAIQRAPVEIWSRILAFAVGCPLLPSDDDSLITNLYLLQYDCEYLALYWESERFRLSCRLVCQSWKKALDVYSHRCFLGRMSDPQINYYQRIQYPSPRDKWAPCHHDYEKLQSCPSIPREPAQVDNQLTPNSVYAFLDIKSYSRRNIWDIAASFPSLQLLSLQAFEDAQRLELPISLQSLSSQLASLTHLALSGFYQTAAGEEEILSLPNLHTLFIDFSISRNAPSRLPLFRKWALPKLRNLGVRGSENNITNEIYSEVQLLIQKVGGNLQGLSLSWVRNHGEEHISDSVWNWCPHLRFLEVSTSNICQMWPPPANPQELVIILMDLKKDLRWTSTLAQSITLLKDSISSKQAKIDGYSFGVPISWSALRQRLEGCDYAPPWGQVSLPLLQLLICLKIHGYALTDRYGVGLESVEARRLIKWLGVQVRIVKVRPARRDEPQITMN